MHRYRHKITFSIEESHWKLLDDRAKRAGVSPHQLARDIFTAGLTDERASFVRMLNLLAEQVQTGREETKGEINTLDKRLSSALRENNDLVRELAGILAGRKGK